ncbi:MAG: family 20 glycosylhydrolase, partial [Lentisphaeria bacterium]|nr:family 20 glycosylhydrolase [Lentisphaeria bacterium]
RRGYFMTIAKLKPEKLPLLKRTLDALASLKMNWLLLELGESFPFADNPYTKRTNAFTKEQVRDLLDFCRRRHIRVTPTLQVWSHSAWMTRHPDWDKMKEGEPVIHWQSQPCPENAEAIRLIDRAINEHIDLFRSRDFFLMMDEFYLGPFHRCEKCRKLDAYRQFKRIVKHFEGLVAGRGVTPIICHDSFIDQPSKKWNFGHRLRGDLDRNTEILWWSYRDRLPEKNIVPFRDFKLIGHSIACKPFNTYNMVRLVRKYNGRASTLVYWYESAATGLLSILERETAGNLGGFVNGADYLWKYPDIAYPELGYDGTFEMVRRLFPEKAVAEPTNAVAAPVPLEAHVNAELSGTGKFPRFADDAATAALQKALSELPERFHLATSPGGKYYGLRLGGEASEPRDRTGIRMSLGDRSIRKLAFLTTTSRPNDLRRYAGAGYYGKDLFKFPVVADITIEYADGGKVKLPLKYRWSITDWNRPFGGVAMRWAVRGLDADKNYYNFGICEFVNPEPERKIRSFLFGSKRFGGISPVILAVSAFGADRPFPRPGKVSPAAVAKRGGVTDRSGAGIRVVYGFEDGMGEVTVSAPKLLMEKLKYEIVADPSSPSGNKVLKVSFPAGNYRGRDRDGGFVRLDLNMPYSIAKGTKALVVDHRIVTSGKGFSHANDYLVDRVAVVADPQARYRSQKLAVSGKWTRDIIPFYTRANAEMPLKDVTLTKYRKVSFFFHEVDAPVEIYVYTIGDTDKALSSMPLWKEGTEAEPM